MALLGVLCGLRREVQPLLEAAAEAEMPVVFRCSGAIADNARTGAEQLVAAGATHLLSFGVAGALRDEGRPGDLIVAHQVMATDDTVYPTDAAWAEAVRAAVPQANDGTLLGLDAAAQSLGQKAFLGAAFDADAIDMESHHLARVAERAMLPFLAVRAIADDRRTLLPRAAMAGVSSSGKDLPHRVVLSLLQRPNELRAIARLARASGRSFKSLRGVARARALLGVGLF